MNLFSFSIRQFLLQSTPASVLGYFRIAVSCFALIQAMFLLPDWMWLYGQNGLIPWDISDALSVHNTPSLLFVYNIMSPFGVSANIVVYLCTALYIISLIGLALGYKTRLMGILAWLMHLIFNTTANLTTYGVENFTQIALFYCMILPVGSSLSIDAGKPYPVPGYLITLSIRLIQLHLCIMYLACGIEKALGAQWWNGEAIWMAMQQDQFHSIDINWMANFPLIPKLLCWSTLLVEVLYPLGIFWKKTKKIWLLAIVGMHLFIGVFLGLHLFAAIMILLNITAFGYHCFGYKFAHQKSESKILRVERSNIPQVSCG